MLTKRKTARMGVRQPTHIRSSGHLKFVRSFVCCAFGRAGHDCQGHAIEAHHIHGGTDGGIGIKPSDSFAVPACRLFHQEIHDKGEEAAARKYGIDFLSMAAKLWSASPHRRKAEE
jgi:hypothetical protein